MKNIGYVISMISVVLLGVVAWQTTVQHPALKPYLIAGMATSLIGMMLRFISHEREKRRQRAERSA